MFTPSIAVNVKCKTFEDGGLLGYHEFIALMMEAVGTSETSVYFNETTR
jgi:hypothetical protein